MFGAQPILTALLKQVKLVYQWELIGCSMVFAREPKMFTYAFTAEVGERNCKGDFSTLTIYTSLPVKWFQLLWAGSQRKGTEGNSTEEEETHQRDRQPHKLGEQIRRAKSTGIPLPFKLKSCLQRKSWIIIVLTATYYLSCTCNYIHLCIYEKYMEYIKYVARVI